VFACSVLATESFPKFFQIQDYESVPLQLSSRPV